MQKSQAADIDLDACGCTTRGGLTPWKTKVAKADWLENHLRHTPGKKPADGNGDQNNDDTDDANDDDPQHENDAVVMAIIIMMTLTIPTMIIISMRTMRLW